MRFKILWTHQALRGLRPFVEAIVCDVGQQQPAYGQNNRLGLVEIAYRKVLLPPRIDAIHFHLPTFVLGFAFHEEVIVISQKVFEDFSSINGRFFVRKEHDCCEEDDAVREEKC
mmetsp:Transcript_31050/g.67104  ORF Transcript_31050/g.67104 Transcript_31050/m.67104 type:complete len:114 (+) Transcript_31050:113-454(+)